MSRLTRRPLSLTLHFTLLVALLCALITSPLACDKAPTPAAEPTKPADPAKPAAPTKPAEPTQPTDPTKPADPTQPTQPTPPLPSITPTTKTVPALPQTLADFTALRDAEAKTPEGGAAVFLVALLAQAENLPDADAMMRLVQHPDSLVNGDIGRSMAGRLKEARNQPQIARSYVQGASPQNGYAYQAPLTYTLRSDPHNGGGSAQTIKLFIASSGAQSDRPIQVKPDAQGFWQVQEYSSLLLGVMKPSP